jgi:putative membrane protein
VVTRETTRQFWLEAKSFWGEAFTWRGAATPRVLPPVAVFGVIAAIVYGASRIGPYIGIPVGAHEIAGAILGLILVVRTNAGYDRWWEGRQLWGGIVNQSRNLAMIVLVYGPNDSEWRREIIRWTIAFAHVARRSLRGEREMPEVVALLGREQAARVAGAVNMPNAVARRIGGLLREARARDGLDDSGFQGAEHQRLTLIESVGDCERILNTPLPRVYSIEIRRSIAFFLVTLTFALISKDLGWVTVLLAVLVAYAILSIDLIGSALQNPFAIHNLGALPLDDICRTIEIDLLGLLADEGRLAEEEEANHDLVPERLGDPERSTPITFASPFRREDEAECGPESTQSARCEWFPLSPDADREHNLFFGR